MKRIVSVLLAFLLASLPVSGVAIESRTLTTEKLLGDILASLADLAESPFFSFDLTGGSDHLHGGILRDSEGNPVIEGGFSSADEAYDVYVSQDGVIVETPEEAQGMHWQDIVQILLDETGLGWISDVATDDVNTLAEIIADIAVEIAGGISPEAVSVSGSSALFNDEQALKRTMDIDVDELIVDLNGSVPQALANNSLRLDEALAGLKPLIREIIPAAEDVNTAYLINLWNGLGFGQVNTDMIIRSQIVSVGDVSEPWKINVDAGEIAFEMQMDGGRLWFELDAGTGAVYAFDSVDLEYLLDLVMQMWGYVTEEACSFKNEISDGAKNILFYVDGVRTQKQLLTALVEVIAENREGIDALITEYRPWIELFAPQAASVTSDMMIMALTVINANGNYRGIWHMLGLGDYISNYIRLQISYPVDEAVPHAAEDGLSPAAESTKSDKPVIFSFEDGFVDIYLYLDNEKIELTYGESFGATWNLKAGFDPYAGMFTATVSREYSYNTRARHYASVTLDVDEKGMRLYTGDGEVEIKATFREGGADISGHVGEDIVTGTLTAAPGNWKLSVTDGHDVYEAGLRAAEDGAELNVNAAGFVLKADVEWDEGYFALNIEQAGNLLHFSADTRQDTVSINWDVDIRIPSIFHSASLTFAEDSVCVCTTLYVYRDTTRIGWETDIRLDWGRENPGLYLTISNENASDITLICRRGQITFIDDFGTVLVSDITPEGSTDKNITRIAMYDGATYRYGNMGERSVDLADCYTLCDIVTEASDGTYTMTLFRDGEALLALELDFDPDAAGSAPENVLWLTPELFRLKYGLVSEEPQLDDDMPIPVYAQTETVEIAN